MAQVRDLATSEFGKFARNIDDIKVMKKKHRITKEQALLQLDIQKNSIKTVLLTEEGLGSACCGGCNQCGFRCYPIHGKHCHRLGIAVSYYVRST